MNTVKTEKGTVLPLLSLRGKDYLQVAHRLVWFNEKETRFDIATEFLSLDNEQTVAKATVTVYNDEGKVVKKATATKRETLKDFPDHTEKAETSAIGRALALLGYGTQFAISDLEEGERLADSPVTNTKSASPVPKSSPENKTTTIETSFRKRKSVTAPTPEVPVVADVASASNNGWDD